MDRKIVTITGGSGFVGQMLRRGLAQQGYRVEIFDKLQGPLINVLRRKYLGSPENSRLVRSVSKRLNRLLPGVEHALLSWRIVRPTSDDILDLRSRIAERFRDSYAVIHLAAIPHPNVPNVTNAQFQRINYEGAVNVFHAARDAGVRKFVFASSAQVYRINEPVHVDQFPILETNYCPTLDQGQTMYGHLKRQFEEYLAQECRSHENIQAVSLRLEFPGIRSTSPNNFYISTSIENTIAGFTCAIESELPSGFDVFNLADAQVDPAIADIQTFLAARWPDVPNRTRGNECLLSTEKARKMLGYRPVAHGSYIAPAIAWA